MTEDTFKTGDIVMLKSGGAAMTVHRFAEGADALGSGHYPAYVECDFFAGVYRREKFSPAQLVHAVKYTVYGENNTILSEHWLPKDEMLFQPWQAADAAMRSMEENTDIIGRLKTIKDTDTR